jgi:hypothetical protein
VIQGEVTCAGVARGFGLSDKADVYIPVEESEAASIAIGVLSYDLAY